MCVVYEYRGILIKNQFHNNLHTEKKFHNILFTSRQDVKSVSQNIYCIMMHVMHNLIHMQTRSKQNYQREFGIHEMQK